MAVPLRAHQQLVLGDPGRVEVRMSRAQHLTVFREVVDVARGHTGPAPHRRAIARGMRRDLAFGSLSQPGLDRVPDSLVAVAPHQTEGFVQHIVGLADHSPDAFAEEVHQLWDGRPPAAWRPAVEEPRRWLADYVDLSLGAWEHVRDYWRAGQAAIDREFARVGVALVEGRLDVLLNELHPRLSFADGVLRFANPGCNAGFDLGSRPLSLVPMLSRSRDIVVGFDAADTAFIAYPVTGPDESEAADLATDRLGRLLGPLRSAALTALSRPMTMSALAGRVHCAASTMTYHCAHLESLGLVCRERRGNVVRVSRTEDGDRLVDLLA